MNSKVLLPPRVGFAAFSFAAGLLFLVIAAIVSISNGEGQGYGFYLGQYLFAVPVLPMAWLMFLNGSSRMVVSGEYILKHDFVTSTRIPIDAIEKFDGENGIDIILKDGTRLEYWGYGSSLIGELFSSQALFKCEYRLNTWLADQQFDTRAPDARAQSRRRTDTKRTIRTDIFKVLCVAACVTIFGSVAAWLLADTLRPAINSPELTSWLE